LGSYVMTAKPSQCGNDDSEVLKFKDFQELSRPCGHPVLTATGRLFHTFNKAVDTASTQHSATEQLTK